MIQRMLRSVSLPVSAAALLVGTASTLCAEPVSLTSGGIFYSRQNQADIRAFGGDYGIFASFGYSYESWDPDHACFGCTPGSSIDLSQTESFRSVPDKDSASVSGSVRVGGVDYRADALDFSISAGTFTLPDTTQSSFSGTVSRFLFSGVLTGTSDAGVTRRFDLTGSGNVGVLFSNNDWFHTGYRFDDASPVPEPGTFLLFGTGVTVAMLRRRKHRRQVAS